MKVFKSMCAVVMAATMVVSGLGGYEAKSVYAGDSLNDCGDNLYSQVGGGTYTLSIGVKDKDNFSGRNMRNFISPSLQSLSKRNCFSQHMVKQASPN